ncbi:LacI family DNA-binding transcriptional regulator [Herbiconiux sp. 11R-BC]|uniref:LacI family DNA-binding transcriptional regulator n=1 Tax=Herbiconiux sp. 11R-BC TaxID=3111637 RepID=UPI003C0016BB
MTISDVAAHAGVSMGTVSNVLNRPGNVAPELVKRVQRSIAELGYVRNSAARSLAAGNSNSVAFVLVDLANSLFVDMARGAESVGQAAGMYLLLANSDVDAEKQRAYLDHFSQEQVAGTLLTLVGDDLSGLEEATRAGQHVVILDADPRLVDCCVVSTDYELAGYLATRHLIELGRSKLVFAGGPLRSTAIGDRYRGAQRAVAEAGAAVRLTHLDSADIRVEDGRRIGEAILAQPVADRPDGFVAAADLVALGAMQALAVAGVTFPGDIALIACDDNKSAYGSVVPISTIDLPGYEMGRSGMQLLLDEVSAPDDHVHRKVTILPRLTARESTVGRSELR